MNHLAELGWVSSEFEGTSYYVFGDVTTRQSISGSDCPRK